MAVRDKIIGIDLGTTNSCVAVCEFGKTVVIPNIEGGRTTPSVVYLDHNGSRLIGAPAKRRAVKYPDRTIASVKRHMGSNHRVMVDNVGYSPEQISSYILEKLKAQAEEYLNEKVSKAIITVPAYFDDSQRLATRHAAKLAGLDVLRVVNEPTACALAYGLNKVAPGQEMNIIIFDFGGGTFDVSILHISEGVVQVKATSGNNRLGGDDFDTRIAQYINSYVIQNHGVNPGADIVSRMRLTEAAEKVKIELSGMRSTHVSMPFLAVSKTGPIHLEMDITVDEFNKITEDLVKATAQPIENALADSRLKPTDIQKVVMVGGTTRIPAVSQFIRSYFKMEPAKTINPDEAIAIGAAIQGGILCGDIEELLLLDVIPMSLGVETDGGMCTRIIDRNTTIPVARTHTFVTTKNNQTNLPVHVLQGEGQTAAGNISLARFQINDIPKAPAGQKVEIEFNVDVDGIFHCGYKHAGSAREAIVLKRTSGFDMEQLDKLLAEEKELLALRAKAQAELDAEEEAARKGGGKKGTSSSHSLPKPPGQQARSSEHKVPPRPGSPEAAGGVQTAQKSLLDTIKEWFSSLLGKK